MLRQCARCLYGTCYRSSSSMARALALRPTPPRLNDRILVFKPQWLSLILAREKTLEVRGRAYRAGRYYLGSGGVIKAQCHLGHAVHVATLRQFKRLEHGHRHFTARVLPYNKTFVFEIQSLREITVPYRHPMGAIGLVRYVPS